MQDVKKLEIFVREEMNIFLLEEVEPNTFDVMAFDLITKRLEPKDETLEVAIKCLERLPEVEHIQKTALVSILRHSELPWQEIINTYEDAIGGPDVADDPDEEDFIEVVDRLWSLPKRNPLEETPIFSFVRGLIDNDRVQGKAAVRDALERWARMVCPGMGVDPKIVLKSEAKKATERGPASPVWVILHREGSKEFPPHKILYRDGNNKVNCYERQSLGNPNIGHDITRVLDTLASEGFTVYDTRIEFMAPYEMMSDKFEEIPLSYGTGSNPLGGNNPVVVRSLERLKSGYTTQLCVPKWNNLASNCSDGDTGKTYVLSVQDLLNLDHPKRVALKSSCVCLGIFGMPDAPALVTAPIQTIVDLNVPIAVWLREGCCFSQEDQKSRIDELVVQSDLFELPEKVRQVRKDAEGSQSPHHGNHLALLFDDPTDIPPNGHLVVP